MKENLVPQNYIIRKIEFEEFIITKSLGLPRWRQMFTLPYHFISLLITLHSVVCYFKASFPFLSPRLVAFSPTPTSLPKRTQAKEKKKKNTTIRSSAGRTLHQTLWAPSTIRPLFTRTSGTATVQPFSTVPRFSSPFFRVRRTWPILP